MERASARSPLGAVTVTAESAGGEVPVAGSKMWWSRRSAEKAVASSPEVAAKPVKGAITPASGSPRRGPRQPEPPGRAVRVRPPRPRTRRYPRRRARCRRPRARPSRGRGVALQQAVEGERGAGRSRISASDRATARQPTRPRVSASAAAPGRSPRAAAAAQRVQRGCTVGSKAPPLAAARSRAKPSISASSGSGSARSPSRLSRRARCPAGTGCRPPRTARIAAKPARNPASIAAASAWTR